MGGLKFEDTLVCHKCDFLEAKKEERTLTYPANWWAWWQHATRVREDLEIMALGTVVDGRVENLWIPKQQVSGGACEILEHSGNANMSMHSHHSMGAFASSDDKATVLPNYTYNVITSHKGDAVGYERVQLPCGGMGFREFKIVYELAPEHASLKELVLAQCEVKKPVVVQPTAVTPYVYTPEPYKGNGTRVPEKWLNDEYEYTDDGIYGTGTPDLVAGCHHCQMYWPKLEPKRCWFCQKETGVVQIDMAMRLWEDAEDVAQLVDVTEGA